MNLLKRSGIMVFLLLGTLAMACATWAQDTQEPPDTETPAKPKPAARGIPGLNDPNATVEDNQDQPVSWQPDTGPATGLQTATLGTPELAHSYWVPGFIYGSMIESQPPGQQTNNGWYANNYIGGELSLVQASAHSQLGLNYSGGGYITTDSQEQNGWFQQLSFGQTIALNRWQIQLFDYFSYLPDSQFGFGAGTGLALPGVTGSLGPAIPGLGISTIPNQTIYSALGPRYSNAFATQVTYTLSRRASITLGGSYGLLNFTQPGNVNNEMALGTAGFNYALSPHDTIGISYRFSGFHYEGEPQALGSQTANFIYQKKIAQELALSLYGGFQITDFRVPVGNQTRNVGPSAGGSLMYSRRRGSISLNYSHGVTAGSGILLGSVTDQATVSLSRQFGRVWTGSVNFGYSRNSSLTTPVGISVASTFGDWFAGGAISRPFGRSVVVSGSYQAAFQNTSQPVCASPSCGTSYTQNIVSITFQYQPRPFVF